MGNKFYANLECLRGLAALMVAIAHCYIAIDFDGVARLWLVPLTSIDSRDAFIARFILIWANGKAAVTVFFILSGVVLGLSLDNNKGSGVGGYCKFLIRRLFRIYPAHMFVLVLLVAILEFFAIVNPGTFVNASVWYNWYYQTPTNLRVVLENLFLVDILLNPVTWTLRVEVAVALFFPVLHYISRRGDGLGWPQVTMLLFLVAMAFFFEQDLCAPHIYKFFLGLLAPSLVTLAVRHSWRPSRRVSGVALILSLGLLLGPPLSGPNVSLNGVIQSVGALVLVIILMTRPGGRLCRLHLSKQLGQYSYSFYLIHFPLVWLSYYLLNQYEAARAWLQDYGLLLASAVCVVTVVAAYVCSAGCYWFVEKPFILWGRRIAEAACGGGARPSDGPGQRAA